MAAAASGAAAADRDPISLPVAHPDGVGTSSCGRATGYDPEQPTLVVGAVGHAAHGKTTLVAALTGQRPSRFRQEARQNMTIQLGYATARIYRCPVCPRPHCFQVVRPLDPAITTDEDAARSSKVAADASPPRPRCSRCAAPAPLMTCHRLVAFIDCPGHEVLMSTMLNGATVMDAALLLVAANEEFPRPQTVEHLIALNVSGVPRVAVVQNKIDLLVDRVSASRRSTTERLTGQADDIRQYMSKHFTVAVQRRSGVDTAPPAGTAEFQERWDADGPPPVIPVSAQLGVNLAFVVDWIATVPVPRRNDLGAPRLSIARSFDVNRPGTTIDRLVGGVVGGTLTRGWLEPGAVVEIRPGLLTMAVPEQPVEMSATVGSQEASMPTCATYRPLRGRVATLKADNMPLHRAGPGGLIAVGLTVDPALCKGNRLVGHVVVHPSDDLRVFAAVDVAFYLLPTTVAATTGTTTAAASGGSRGRVPGPDHSPVPVGKLKVGERLHITVGTRSVMGRVALVRSGAARFCFDEPCCASTGTALVISRPTSCGAGGGTKLRSSARLFGWGSILSGSDCPRTVPLPPGDQRPMSTAA